MKKTSFPPTAIQTFERCKRKYFYESVLKIRQPESESKKKGDLFHAEIQAYFETGKQPTEERVQESLKNLPKPGCMGARVEQAFAIDIDDERHIQAKSDLKFYDRYAGKLIPHVIDHKSSKDPDRYGKAPQELTEDIQVNIYAQKALMDDPEAQEVLVSHHYIATEKAIRSWLTTVDEPLPREKVERNFKKYLKVIDEMTEVRKHTHPSQVPPDGKEKNACKDYGGCHVRDRCEALIFTGLRKETMGQPDLKAELKAKLAKLQAGTPSVAMSPAVNAEVKKSTKRLAAPPETEEVEETEEEIEEEAPPPPPPKRVAKPALKPAPESVVEEAPTADEPKQGPILLINCMAQVGVEQVSLETWLAPYLAMIEEQTGKNINAIPYREGVAMLEQCIEAADDLPEALIIDSRSYLGSNALPALMRRNPQAIFRGTF